MRRNPAPAADTPAARPRAVLQRELEEPILFGLGRNEVRDGLAAAAAKFLLLMLLHLKRAESWAAAEEWAVGTMDRCLSRCLFCGSTAIW